MKYENFDQIKEIVDQIKKHEDTLSEIGDLTTVRLCYESGNSIMTIGTWESCEHQYKKQANELVEYIKSDLNRRIDVLKSMLESL